ncbi:hypothetical protein L1887_58275 [Cichorium endivia]|nr:hypothetical protein L1887_58275 [Cichorium endivia]
MRRIAQLARVLVSQPWLLCTSMLVRPSLQLAIHSTLLCIDRSRRGGRSAPMRASNISLSLASSQGQTCMVGQDLQRARSCVLASAFLACRRQAVLCFAVPSFHATCKRAAASRDARQSHRRRNQPRAPTRSRSLFSEQTPARNPHVASPRFRDDLSGLRCD